MLAAEALHLLEENKITSLLVAGKDNSIIGALNIHDLFREGLEREFPDRAKHVMNLVRDTRGGRDNDPEFGARMSGRGPYAWQIGRRFELACKRLGLNRQKQKLRADLFTRPVQPGEQLSLL